MLFPYTELVYDLTVTVQIAFLQVIQMTAPLTNHFQETPPRMMVLFVRLQMLRQVANATAQDRNLNFRGARV